MKQLCAILWSGWAILCIWGCQQAASGSVEREEDLPTQGEMEVQDTLRLREGRLPEDWHKVDLGDGYYIGFPREPRRQHSNSQRRTEYILKRNKYRFHSSVTELDNLPSFQEYSAYQTAYYDAVLQDLAEAIDADIQQQQQFISQGVYEGMRALLVAEEVRLYVQCLMIEARLYTFTYLIYDEEKPAYLQLKDRFFASFGNERYNDPHPTPTENDSSKKETTH